MPGFDPQRNTREDFTSQLLAPPLRDFAKPKWKDLASKLRNLLQKIAYHDAMKPNLQQTYMTPAASKNSIYFMSDYVGRTIVPSIRETKLIINLCN